ncbi:MAG: hypothetical protein QG573_1043, partial [Acidobacteriota bacterium]|nr:hypothetical protein [Acidobacteriota bacterium]
MELGRALNRRAAAQVALAGVALLACALAATGCGRQEPAVSALAAP